MTHSPTIIKPKLTTQEAYKLVKMIKESSDYSGMLVMLSIASTLQYISYYRPEYCWLKPKGGVQK